MVTELIGGHPGSKGSQGVLHHKQPGSNDSTKDVSMVPTCNTATVPSPLERDSVLRIWPFPSLEAD